MRRCWPIKKIISQGSGLEIAPTAPLFRKGRHSNCEGQPSRLGLNRTSVCQIVNEMTDRNIVTHPVPYILSSDSRSDGINACNLGKMATSHGPEGQSTSSRRYTRNAVRMIGQMVNEIFDITHLIPEVCSSDYSEIDCMDVYNLKPVSISHRPEG